MEKTIIMTVGLPRSGKSTWSRNTAKEYGFPMVNPDSIRKAMHGQAYIREMEPMIWVIAKYMVESLFEAGHDTVILDATNLHGEARKRWNSKKWNVKYKVFNADAETCKGRVTKTNQHLVESITRMSKFGTYPEETWIKKTDLIAKFEIDKSVIHNKTSKEYTILEVVKPLTNDDDHFYYRIQAGDEIIFVSEEEISIG